MDAQYALCALLHGSVTFNQFSEQYGETVIEARTPLSLLGVTCHPSDGFQLARFGEEAIAAAGCLSVSECEKLVKEAHGVHRGERWRVIRSMQKYPLFQHCTLWELYTLSYFFYKVELKKGDVIGKEGISPGYLCYVYDGCVERREREKKGWKAKEREMKKGCFIGMDEIMTNSVCPCDYTVTENTTVFVLNPSVLDYYVGGRFIQAGRMLNLYRHPSTLDLSELESVVQGLRALNIQDGVVRMRTGYEMMRNDVSVRWSEEEVKKKEALVALLKVVYGDDETTEQTPHPHKEGVDYAVAAGIDAIQTLNLVDVVNTVYASVSEWFGGKSEELIDSAAAKQSVESVEKQNDLNDYSDVQIVAVLNALQFNDPAKAAKWLLYLKLCGSCEVCELRREDVALDGNEQEKKEILDFLFHSKNTLSFDEFTERMKNSTLPASLQTLLQTLQSAVTTLNPTPVVHNATQREVGVAMACEE